MTDIVIQQRRQAEAIANAAAILEQLGASTERLDAARAEMIPASELHLPIAMLEALAVHAAELQARVEALENSKGGSKAKS